MQPESIDPAPISRAARWKQRATDAKEQALEAADRIPVARRLLSELKRVEVIDRSLAIGAQALLALLPLMVVIAAYTPADFGTEVMHQVRESMGLSPDVLGPVRDLTINEGQVRTNTGIIGLIVTLVSATSFSRALQRMYAKVFEQVKEPRSGALKSSVIWLFGWLAYLQAFALMSGILHKLPGDPVIAIIVQFIAQTFIWLWTARIMLLWRVPWSQLLPGALLTAIGVFWLVRLSQVFMPAYARSSVEQFGSLGVILAAASWLVALGGVLVVATTVGRVMAEQPAWDSIATRLRLVKPDEASA